MELADLTGLHKLSGVDLGNREVRDWGENLIDAEYISFILDGKTYTAVQDPNDGYRSSMKNIFVDELEVKNKFEPVSVFGVMKQGNNDTLQLYDVETKKNNFRSRNG